MPCLPIDSPAKGCGGGARHGRGESEGGRRVAFTLAALRLLEIPANTLEPVHGLPGQPLHDSRVVVAPADNVVERREAVGFTHLLHLGELRALELVRTN